MRRIAIEHITRYSYAEKVRFLSHKLHVRPREGHDIRIESSSLEIAPAYRIEWQRDLFGNSVAVIDFEASADELTIASKVVVQHYAAQQAQFELAEHARQYPFHYDPLEHVNLIPYQLPIFTADYAAVGEWLKQTWRPGSLVDTAELLGAINRRIAASIAYTVRDEPGVQSPGKTLDLGRGSCRDVATLFIEACRYCGLAGRFVSGYLVSNAAVEDHATTHAWSEIYLPGSGWVGFDSTSGQMVGGEHIAVAVHQHPEAIPPVSGAFVGSPKAEPEMHVDVRVDLLESD